MRRDELRCLYLRLCRILIEMADEFFSSSWRILEWHGVQDLGRCFVIRAIVEALTVPWTARLP
jgi:hypothetical protein